MATDVVKAAILSILQDKDFDLQTPRMKIARESAQKVLDMISGKNKSARDHRKSSARIMLSAN